MNKTEEETEYLLVSRRTKEEERAMKQFHSFPILLKIHLFQPEHPRHNEKTTEDSPSNVNFEQCNQHHSRHPSLLGQLSSFRTCDDSLNPLCLCKRRIECSSCEKRFKISCMCTLGVDISKFKCKDCIMLAVNACNRQVGEEEANPPMQVEECIMVMKSFKCRVCSKTFAHKGNLNRHKKIHSANRERRHKCQECESAFFSAQELLNHQIFKHTEDKPFECGTCSSSFKTRSLLGVHMKIHIGTKNFECPVCSKKFLSGSAMGRHQKTHSSDRDRSHRCDICKAAFFDIDKLLRHKRQVHTDSKDYICTTCSKTFKSKDSLQRHTLVHTGVKPFQCLSCEKTFMRRTVLKRHEETHLSNRERPHKCKKCDTAFFSFSDLQRHTSTVHVDVSYPCDLCPKLFKTRGGLKEHLKCHFPNAANAAKKFVCAICKKALKNIRELKRHEESHSSKRERKSCPICNKKVLYLDQHMTWHSTMKEGLKHKCSKCKATFYTNSDLVRHENSVHSEERKHCCDLCGNAYKTLDSLQRHCKQRH